MQSTPLTNRIFGLWFVTLCFFAASATAFAIPLTPVAAVAPSNRNTTQKTCDLLHPLCTSDDQCPVAQFCVKPWGTCDHCKTCCDSLTHNGCADACGHHLEHPACGSLNFSNLPQDCISRSIAPTQACDLQDELHDLEERFSVDRLITKCFEHRVMGEMSDCRNENFDEYARTCRAVGWDMCRVTLSYQFFGVPAKTGIIFDACFVKSCAPIIEGLERMVSSVTLDVDCDDHEEESPPKKMRRNAKQVDALDFETPPSDQTLGPRSNPTYSPEPQTDLFLPEERFKRAVCEIAAKSFPAYSSCDAYRIFVFGNTALISFSDRGEEIMVTMKSGCIALVLDFYDFFAASSRASLQDTLTGFFATRGLSNDCAVMDFTEHLHTPQTRITKMECLAPHGTDCQTITGYPNGTVIVKQAHTRITVQKPGETLCFMIENDEKRFNFGNEDWEIREVCSTARLSECPESPGYGGVVGEKEQKSRNLLVFEDWKRFCTDNLLYVNQLFNAPRTTPESNARANTLESTVWFQN